MGMGVGSTYAIETDAMGRPRKTTEKEVLQERTEENSDNKRGKRSSKPEMENSKLPAPKRGGRKNVEKENEEPEIVTKKPAKADQNKVAASRKRRAASSSEVAE